ncbi:small integral membrane protein 30-like [Carassius carassius]|uniref:small integral membrane protein 30-like n=1 Tax=Carassius carassius TaxID=217509 RepID=UPI002868E10F|nr:small integral membrane protein 30-like [Carassius carassius]
MAPKDQNSLVMLCLLLLTLVQTAEAFDGGDAAALLLGATVTLVGVCACLGWYARRRNGQF